MAILSACSIPPSAPNAPPTPAGAAVAQVRSPAAAALHALFAASWEEDMRRYPEWATYLGDNRYGGRLSDESPEQEAADKVTTRERLARARAIERNALDAKDRTSLDLFIHGLEERLLFEPLVGYRRMTLGVFFGFHVEFVELLQVAPMRTVAQAEQVLDRMAAWPKRVDQELVRLREGQALGWVAAQPVLARVLQVLDAQLAGGGKLSPFFEPFTRLASEIPAAEQARLRAAAMQRIAADVLPAQRRLREFVAGPYAAAAPASGGLGSYPGGGAVYAAEVRRHTTTELTPAQIHAVGEREVARLRGEMHQVMKEMGWRGDFASFVHHLKTDPKYFHASGEALLAGYRDIGKRIDAELPKLFAELPRAPWGVRAMPAHAGPDATESYVGPAADGSRPGWVNANAVGFKTRPIWGMETFMAHEAVPGHHLQVARALELVVDTGLHERSWSRQRAIDYLVEQVGTDRGYLENEVDRYLSWPGQALGYMIGQLKIVELRDRARARLGHRFDIRRFHMAVLDQGAVPLGTLERLVDEWIASELVRR